MVTIKVGGVPEHFNMPWHYAIEQDLFEQQNIDLKWIDFPGGTGAMNTALREETIDVAVILTEGIVADILKGNTSKLVQWYVKSPLIWGIHVSTKSAIASIEQIEGKRYAISRFGSGSHLMAYVDAYQRGFVIEESQFVVVNNLDGAVKALQDGVADVFMWEKFMTQPYVDATIFKRIGVCPTPWPSFVIAVREKVLVDYEQLVFKLLELIKDACKQFYSLPNAVNLIAEKFNLQKEDVALWMQSIHWENQLNFDATPLKEVVETLANLKIIEKEENIEALIYKPKL